MSVARFAVLAIVLVAIQAVQPAMARTPRPRVHHRTAHGPRRPLRPTPVKPTRSKPKPSTPHTTGSSAVALPTKP